jgi:hypothetical protein
MKEQPSRLGYLGRSIDPQADLEPVWESAFCRSQAFGRRSRHPPHTPHGKIFSRITELLAQRVKP